MAPSGRVMPNGSILVEGKPLSEWTQQEVDDALMWQLGGHFRDGLRPPPAPVYYQPPVPDRLAADIERMRPRVAASAGMSLQEKVNALMGRRA